MRASSGDISAMRQHFARSCLVPLLLSALLSGFIPPASASGDVICKYWDGKRQVCEDPPELGKEHDETCKDCPNCVFDGSHWSCEPLPDLDCGWENGQWTCVDLAKRREEVFWEVVSFVLGVIVLPLVTATGFFWRRRGSAPPYYCDRCKSVYGMRGPWPLGRETELGTAKWVCKYCGHVQYWEKPLS